MEGLGVQEVNASTIVNYLSSQMMQHGDLYKECYTAKVKYTDPSLNYYYTDEDYDNFIMLASAWSAIIRSAWRIFIINEHCEEFHFWNAFIKVFFLGQQVLMHWDSLGKYHKRLKEKIRKTSNPKFIEKMFTGMNWKWLLTEMEGTVNGS